MPNPTKTTTPRKSGWSPARRASHAAAIRRWKPWAKSTGPRSAPGKARSAQNAYKHGAYALQRRLYAQALSAQRHCVRACLLHRRLAIENPRNELLARLLADIRKLHRIFLVRLWQSLERERLCKNLAFSPPFRQIVNAKTHRHRPGAASRRVMTTALQREDDEQPWLRQTRKRNPRGGGHVGRGGFIRHGGAAPRTGL